MESTIVDPLSKRIRAARAQRGWTLERLAEASGVSRAMISKIERGEVSPTAVILARLAAGLGVSLASLFSDDTAAQSAPSPLARERAGARWRDPATGYVRRNVSPAAARGAAEIVDVTFPAGARVMFDNATATPDLAQQVWVIEGQMDMTVGEETTHLEAGDCLLMRLDRPLVFHNPTDRPARYAVVLSRLPTSSDEAP